MHVFTHLFIYSYIHLFIYSFIHLFIYSFVHLFIYLSICLFIYLYITYICLHICRMYLIKQHKRLWNQTQMQLSSNSSLASGWRSPVSGSSTSLRHLFVVMRNRCYPIMACHQISPTSKFWLIKYYHGSNWYLGTYTSPSREATTGHGLKVEGQDIREILTPANGIKPGKRRISGIPVYLLTIYAYKTIYIQ